METKGQAIIWPLGLATDLEIASDERFWKARFDEVYKKAIADTRADPMMPANPSMMADYFQTMDPVIRFKVQEIVDEERRQSEIKRSLWMNELHKAAELFGFPPGVEPPLAELNARWRELRGQLHPDRGGDADKFDQAQKAYNVLHTFVTRVRPCPACDGSGETEIRRGFTAMKQTCKTCHGTGETKSQPNGEERL
jgi:hypothetical protein